MIVTRTGLYGSYYGTPYNESAHLSLEQMQLNAYYIYHYLTAKGWTVESIAATLGNMEAESSLNPGRWEGENVGVGPGYGLVQWTPYTKYTNWCAEMGYTDPSTMDNNLARIIYELENNEQYYATDSYPETFVEYTQSTKSPYYLACAFAWNYERSEVVLNGTEEQKEALRQYRGGRAEYWYTYLTENPPPKPPTPKKKKHIMYNSKWAIYISQMR